MEIAEDFIIQIHAVKININNSDVTDESRSATFGNGSKDQFE